MIKIQNRSKWQRPVVHLSGMSYNAVKIDEKNIEQPHG